VADILFAKILRFIFNNNNKTPMQTSFTLSEKAESIALSNKNYTNKELQPQKATLQRILQFAAIYKAERINENWIIDVYLN